MNLPRLIFLVSTLLVVLIALCTLRAQHRPTENVNRDALIQQDFQNRIAAYMKLRKTVEAELPKLKPTELSAKIAEHEHELARRIRVARRHARQGEFFNAEIGAEFRRLIGITMRGSEAARIQQSLRSAEPVDPQLRVNDEYPVSIPLQSTPPTLLENLPKLPPEVDYRVAAHDLLLRDAGANLIVDLLPGAIP
jgi:hypothetical protein